MNRRWARKCDSNREVYLLCHTSSLYSFFPFFFPPRVFQIAPVVCIAIAYVGVGIGPSCYPLFDAFPVGDIGYFYYYFYFEWHQEAVSWYGIDIFFFFSSKIFWPEVDPGMDFVSGQSLKSIFLILKG